MRSTKSIITTILSFIIVIGSCGDVFARDWNNPERKKRYQQLQRETIEAYRNESRAWTNYDRELRRAQEDARRVRNGFYKGARKGPHGAVWGGAKGAAKSLYYRGRDYYNQRYRR